MKRKIIFNMINYVLIVTAGVISNSYSVHILATIAIMVVVGAANVLGYAEGCFPDSER